MDFHSRCLPAKFVQAEHREWGCMAFNSITTSGSDKLWHTPDEMRTILCISISTIAFSAQYPLEPLTTVRCSLQPRHPSGSPSRRSDVLPVKALLKVAHSGFTCTSSGQLVLTGAVVLSCHSCHTVGPRRRGCRWSWVEWGAGQHIISCGKLIAPGGCLSTWASHAKGIKLRSSLSCRGSLGAIAAQTAASKPLLAGVSTATARSRREAQRRERGQAASRGVRVCRNAWRHGARPPRPLQGGLRAEEGVGGGSDDPDEARRRPRRRGDAGAPGLSPGVTSRFKLQLQRTPGLEVPDSSAQGRQDSPTVPSAEGERCMTPLLAG